MKRVLILATTTGYQTRMFSDAAAKLGVDVVFASDRCDQIDDPWADGAIAVRYHEEWRSVDTVLNALGPRGVDGVLALGDRPTVLAARVAAVLGLPGHSPDAAAAARDKRLTRERQKEAGLPVPDCVTVPVSADAGVVLDRISLPVVIKPTVLSGSRGVIRADDGLSFVTAFGRVRELLGSPAVRQLRDAEADIIQIETYIPGLEYAIEGVLDHGRFETLAIFDKPDPLEGPFFEETIYVTPSRADRAQQGRIESAVAASAAALGLHHGPVHAECRVNDRGIYVLEVAARCIGGLCARTLRFGRPDAATIGLEELLLRHATGESIVEWVREPGASAVMMIPIPKSGVYRRVDGVAAAEAIRGIAEVRITAKPDQGLLALPEGATYLGFIFARTATPAEAEQAVRAAHDRLRFTIDPPVPMAAPA